MQNPQTKIAVVEKDGNGNQVPNIILSDPRRPQKSSRRNDDSARFSVCMRIRRLAVRDYETTKGKFQPTGSNPANGSKFGRPARGLSGPVEVNSSMRRGSRCGFGATVQNWSKLPIAVVVEIACTHVSRMMTNDNKLGLATEL